MSQTARAENWRARAACRAAIDAGEADANWWFPENDRYSQRSAEKAKAICDPCPVKQRCLEEGFGERDGIWGGLGYTKRRGLVDKHCARCDVVLGKRWTSTYCDRCAAEMRRQTHRESSARRRLAG